MSGTDTPDLTDRGRFPVWTTEKLRYCDTDRQGHINNSVFAQLCEAGRVGFLYDPAAPAAVPGTAFEPFGSCRKAEPGGSALAVFRGGGLLRLLLLHTCAAKDGLRGRIALVARVLVDHLVHARERQFTGEGRGERGGIAVVHRLDDPVGERANHPECHDGENEDDDNLETLFGQVRKTALERIGDRANLEQSGEKKTGGGHASTKIITATA